MILADTNFWLALSLSKHQFHSAARNFFDHSTDRVSFCRSTQQSFLRLLTTNAVMRLYDLPPLTNAAAWSLYVAFTADGRVTFLDEPGGIEKRWQEYAARDSASPKLWMDAYLAALAREAGCMLVTTDEAFGQFAQVEAIILRR